MVYSEDTEPCPRVAALAKEAYLLNSCSIHECSFPEPFDVTNHTMPKKLGNLIENQGAKRVSHVPLHAGAGCEDGMHRH